MLGTETTLPHSIHTRRALSPCRRSVRLWGDDKFWNSYCPPSLSMPGTSILCLYCGTHICLLILYSSYKYILIDYTSFACSPAPQRPGSLRGRSDTSVRRRWRRRRVVCGRGKPIFLCGHVPYANVHAVDGIIFVARQFRSSRGRRCRV